MNKNEKILKSFPPNLENDVQVVLNILKIKEEDIKSSKNVVMLIVLNHYKEANEILLSILERNPTYQYANELIALLNAHNKQQAD